MRFTTSARVNFEPLPILVSWLNNVLNSVIAFAAHVFTQNAASLNIFFQTHAIMGTRVQNHDDDVIKTSISQKLLKRFWGRSYIVRWNNSEAFILPLPQTGSGVN